MVAIGTANESESCDTGIPNSLARNKSEALDHFVQRNLFRSTHTSEIDFEIGPRIRDDRSVLVLANPQAGC